MFVLSAVKCGRCMNGPRSSLFLISSTFAVVGAGFGDAAALVSAIYLTPPAVKLEARESVKCYIELQLASRVWIICALNPGLSGRTKSLRGFFCFHGMFGNHFLTRFVCRLHHVFIRFGATPAGGDITDIPGSGKLWNDCAIIFYFVQLFKEILKIRFSPSRLVGIEGML